MDIECPGSDIISTLPQNIIETILTRMPIRDALRTSILSKKWRYTWRTMPKLVFTDYMVEVPSDCGCERLTKYKLVNAIFHVLLFHSGPTVLKFVCSVAYFNMESEFAQIMSHLARENKVKELIFLQYEPLDKLPISFFSLNGLEVLCLSNVTFEPPLTFNGFSQLKSLKFYNVKVSDQMLQSFLSRCPLLELVYLNGDMDFVAGGNDLTFVDLLQCVPLIRSLKIAYYMKYLSAGGMPHELPTSLVHLEHLFLSVCMTEQNEISSALCLIRSSPFLMKMNIRYMINGKKKKLPVGETPTNFLDPENHSDLKLAHLEILEIQMFRNLPLEMEFVKLIMAKSPLLKKIGDDLHFMGSEHSDLVQLFQLLPFIEHLEMNSCPIKSLPNMLLHLRDLVFRWTVFWERRRVALCSSVGYKLPKSKENKNGDVLQSE